MASKLYDTMILLPEHEYLILKEQNDKFQNKDLTPEKGGERTYNQLPGLPPEKLEQPNLLGANKEEISSNWAILWRPL